MQESHGKPGNANRETPTTNRETATANLETSTGKRETRTWIIHLLKQDLLSFEHHRTLAFRYIT